MSAKGLGVYWADEIKLTYNLTTYKFLKLMQKTIQKALIAHRAGRLEDAEALYRSILQVQPQHPDVNHNLGVLNISLNKLDLALPLLKTALEANPKQGQFWLSYIDVLIKVNQLDDARSVLKQGINRGLSGENVETLKAKLKSISLLERPLSKVQIQNPSQADIHNLLDHYQKGQYDLAENLAKEFINQYPNHQFGWKVFGAVLKHSGRLEEALIANEKVVNLSPKDAEAHSNLGITLKGLGRLDDAVASYRVAIAIKPDLAEAHSNLGITLKELGRLDDAVTSYRTAIAINPDYAEAHNNLGVTQKDLGKLDDAVASYHTAISLKSGFAEAYSNLGGALQELGKFDDAEASCRKAIAIKPNLAEAHSNLGITLQELGKLEEAFEAVVESLKIKPFFEAKSLFIELSKLLNIQTGSQTLSKFIISALLEPWGRPSNLIGFACRFLKIDREFIQILHQFKDSDINSDSKENLISSISKNGLTFNSLLCAMLTSGPIPDAEIETFLTILRRNVLKAALTASLKENDEVAVLHCSLAQQCFINEYVYYQTTEEIADSHKLLNQLTQALEGNQSIPAILVVAVACYFPLFSITGAEKLLYQDWPYDVNKVLKQQIQEPLEEFNIQSSIGVLTRIDNHVSLAVKNQYEENPYPRWIRLPKDSSKKFINTYIQRKFPLSSFKKLDNDTNPEILIAGCGTGQVSIGIWQIIEGAKILAVDLSMASLAYAKRKTIEFEIDDIDYKQADLLQLGSLNQYFDVIESSGVLHHLENPFKGWEVLLSVLRTNGLMRLGFYSELARQDIVRVRKLITEDGLGSSPQEIRDYRKHLLDLKGSRDYGFATSSSDFFSTSACRDLLFHVQEHRMTLPILASFIKDQNLNFLGFDTDSFVIHAYKKRFPNDPSATNLDQWHIYEEENPTIFARMYQFWVQKKN